MFWLKSWLHKKLNMFNHVLLTQEYVITVNEGLTGVYSKVVKDITYVRCQICDIPIVKETSLRVEALPNIEERMMKYLSADDG